MVKILSVAGYDGSGGAGITSDAKIFSGMGIYGLSAITVMTAQNPSGVNEVKAVPCSFFEKELKAVFDYFSVDAVKAGIIPDRKHSVILARYIKKYGVKTFVVDPVFISTSGEIFFNGKNKYPDFLAPLFKYATVITPNSREAEVISGMNINNAAEMVIAAREVRKKFPSVKNIVIKGSHINEDGAGERSITNILLDSNDGIFTFGGRRIRTDKEIHGTGCAFSAVLTACLAKGMDIRSACVVSDDTVAGFIKNCVKVSENLRDRKIYCLGNK